VPPGTSRLRLAVMASHTKSELREAAAVLAATVPAAARRASELPASAGENPARPARVFDGLADAA
jgi:hypothetical protein